MNEKELKEIIILLKNQGWQPLICDTPVPYYDNPVACGIPTAVGDLTGENVLLPKEILSMHPEFMVTVTGDSMKDADIEKGDIVKVVAADHFYDSDIVLVCIDGEMTLKVYCEDEDGNPWLVPQNEAYDAFPLKDKVGVRIVGKVTEIFKQVRRVPSRTLMKCIRKAKEKMVPAREFTQLQVSRTIRELAQVITIGRLWYAVYRVMVDLNIIREQDYDGFCQMVAEEVPDHQHLPNRVEMQRLAVQSFAKPTSRWKNNDAPVTGKRFVNYMLIVEKTKELLGA